MTQQQLDRCTRYAAKEDNLHVCEATITSTDISATSCLGSVYIGKPNHELCQYKYSRRVDKIYLLDKGTLVAFAGIEEGHSFEYCANLTYHERIPVQHGRKLAIRKGCKIVVGKGEYIPSDSYTVDLQHQVHLTPRVQLHLPPAHRDLVQVMLDEVKEITSAAVRMRQVQGETRSHDVIVISGAYLALASVVAAAIGLYVFAFCRYRRRKRDRKIRKKENKVVS